MHNNNTRIKTTRRRLYLLCYFYLFIFFPSLSLEFFFVRENSVNALHFYITIVLCGGKYKTISRARIVFLKPTHRRNARACLGALHVVVRRTSLYIYIVYPPSRFFFFFFYGIVVASVVFFLIAYYTIYTSRVTFSLRPTSPSLRLGPIRT